MTVPMESNRDSMTGGNPWLADPGILYLAGPTASGKSRAALVLAEKMGAEIVSVDSMQVYRGMDIGTAKPTADERARVPHHLIDLVDLNETFDAACFVREATRVVETVRKKGAPLIFCGGTGLYFKAWLEGLGEAPASDPQLRSELEATPLHLLLEELAQSDPETYARIDRNNPRRVVRALEVIRLTGKTYTEQRSQWSQAPMKAGVHERMIYLVREPAELRGRIEKRVDQMMDAGWVEETERLRELGLENQRGPMQALGYRLILEHLRGERTLKETVEWIKIKTWQYARRQATWFRRQGGFEWVPAENVEEKMAQGWGG